MFLLVACGYDKMKKVGEAHFLSQSLFKVILSQKRLVIH